MTERKSSIAKIRANARYNAKKYDVLQIRVLKTQLINERIDLAVKAGCAKSKADYVLQAVNDRLKNDGFGGVMNELGGQSED